MCDKFEIINRIDHPRVHRSWTGDKFSFWIISKEEYYKRGYTIFNKALISAPSLF